MEQSTASTERSESVRREKSERVRAYWRANLQLIGVLMLIWFLAGYVHVPFARGLNQVTILTGFPLGYWLASQASITIFVILIFTYALVMNKVIDPKYGYSDEE